MIGLWTTFRAKRTDRGLIPPQKDAFCARRGRGRGSCRQSVWIFLCFCLVFFGLEEFVCAERWAREGWREFNCYLNHTCTQRRGPEAVLTKPLYHRLNAKTRAAHTLNLALRDTLLQLPHARKKIMSSTDPDPDLWPPFYRLSSRCQLCRFVFTPGVMIVAGESLRICRWGRGEGETRPRPRISLFTLISDLQPLAT